MISRHHAFALAALIAGQLSLALEAAAEVRYDRHVRTVDLPTRPEFPNSLILDMTRVMPEVNGEHALAVTYGDVKWHFKSSGLNGLCVIDAPLVEVNARVSIPEWPRWRDAAQNWQDAWTCIDKYLVSHENTHADIWRETGDEIDAALAAFRQPSSCHGFNDRASAAAQRAFDAGKQRQMAFDAGQKRFADVRHCLAEFNAGTAEKAKDQSATDQRVRAAAATAAADDGQAGTGEARGFSEIARAILVAHSMKLGIFAGILALGSLFAFLMRAVSEKQPAHRRSRVDDDSSAADYVVWIGIGLLPLLVAAGAVWLRTPPREAALFQRAEVERNETHVNAPAPAEPRPAPTNPPAERAPPAVVDTQEYRDVNGRISQTVVTYSDGSRTTTDFDFDLKGRIVRRSELRSDSSKTVTKSVTEYNFRN